jgi:hypothetical protein
MPWFKCRVDKTGPIEDGRVMVLLTPQDGQFTRWFVATDAIRREILSTALTAMSTGLLVEAGLSSPDENSVIERLYITR